MSQGRRIDDRNRSARVLGLAAVLWIVVASSGCGMISSSNNHTNGDPLHLGVHPGPLGSTTPQSYSNVNYRPPTSPAAFVMVADRISQ
jgi:hypothetical protein